MSIDTKNINLIGFLIL